jgi:flagellar motor switch protein FliN
MSQDLRFLDCWMQVATSLLSQALVGEPVLSDALPKPLPEGSFGFAATIDGDEQGRFVILLDGGLAEGSLLGDVPDVRAAWAELIRETVEAAAGDLLARSGTKCRVAEFGPANAESKITRAFQLSAGERSWVVLVASDLKPAKAEAAKTVEPSARTAEPTEETPARTATAARPSEAPPTDTSMLSEGLQLLLDVELEASLCFGSREMPLGEILDLGPGDVVQLDRHISDPVDLVVGDKIVARGEVVLVNGNFGLRVTQVAEPQRRLESIRCLF